MIYRPFTENDQIRLQSLDGDRDFKKTVLDFIDTAEEFTGHKVGLETPDVGPSKILIALSNARKHIEKDNKNFYTITIPFMDSNNLYNRGVIKDCWNMANSILRSADFKTDFAGNPDEIGEASAYYYKKVKSGAVAIANFKVNTRTGNTIFDIMYVKDDKAVKYISKNIIREGQSISSEDLGHEEEDITPNNSGFEGMSIEDYLGYDPEIGMARSEELAKDDVYGNFFRDPKVMAAFTEHMDMTDRITRLAVIHMNEAEQDSVLTSLTSKLYDNIVARVDDIDYGEIPETKGDITKLSNYSKLRECISLMKDILKEFKQDPGPINVVDEAITNVISHKDLFVRAFKYDVELPIMVYNNTVLSIINAVSYMIATSIEFIKTPNQDSFKITLDKVAYSKTKSNMIYNNLKKFNVACKNGDMDKALEHVIQHRVKKLSEGVGIAIAAVAGTVGVLLTIIPILREMVFFFYYTRMRVSDFLNIQADLLQMNAHNLENNGIKNDSEKKRIVSKQLKIVEFFRKTSNKIAFSNKEAEVKTTREIEASSKKMKLNDLSDEIPDSVSALF